MNPPPEIDIRVLDPRLRTWGFPHYGSAMAAGLDLHACLDDPLELRPGADATLISAGFAMRIGAGGWCALLAPRSGSGHRGLVLGNTIGVIDADYEGPIMMSAWNRRVAGPGDQGTIVIMPGDRIAQMLVIEAARPLFSFVDAFGSTSGRGEGGFGSTGLGGVGEQA